MTHANAKLTPLGRLQVARYRVVDGATIRATAHRFQVSTTTVVRWSGRYADVLGAGRVPTAADMTDHSSRPLRSPARTHARLERKVVHLRGKKGLGPVDIAARVGLPASTVHAVLVRHGLNRLADFDQATRAKIRAEARARRYERPHPGDLVHLDVKKVARIPDGGVRRLPTGQRVRGRPRRQRQPSQPVDGTRGYLFVHTAIDDHSRLAYSEALSNETGATAAAFWRRAQTFFAAHGVTVREVLTDNGPCYQSFAFAAALAGITHRRTQPYRPQTNGKVERFHRTMTREWVYAKVWTSESARLAALTSWLRTYNHHRPHTALRRQPPISRVTTPTQVA